ncbi:glycogenin glucosyltransferase [Tulasnella sp. 403]|nr:glycogenin glucosyltransferase [Tulasnella sp. 403]
MAHSPSYAFVTLLTSDSYLPGALTLVAALRDVHANAPSPPQLPFKTVCLITPETLSVDSRRAVLQAFDVVIGVNVLKEDTKKGLELLGRPDLSLVLTKLHVFRLTQFDKIIFLDADVLPIRPLSHLFALTAPFSAVPDVGWPDIFNSGFMVLQPGQDKFDDIMRLVRTKGSWDGGDQGILNEWRGDDWNRLSFTYNTTPTAAYTYAPAFERFGSEIKAIHFIGTNKPWNNLTHRAPGSSSTTSSASTGQLANAVASSLIQPSYGYSALVDKWYNVYDAHYRPSVPSEAQKRDMRQRTNFELPKFHSIWNAEGGKRLPTDSGGGDEGGGRPGGATMELDDLRLLGMGGWQALASKGYQPVSVSVPTGLPEMGLGYVGPASERGEAEYIPMPLDGEKELNEIQEQPVLYAYPFAHVPSGPPPPRPEAVEKFIEPPYWAPPATATSEPPSHLFKGKPKEEDRSTSRVEGPRRKPSQPGRPHLHPAARAPTPHPAHRRLSQPQPPRRDVLSPRALQEPRGHYEYRGEVAGPPHPPTTIVRRHSQQSSHARVPTSESEILPQPQQSLPPRIQPVPPSHRLPAHHSRPPPTRAHPQTQPHHMSQTQSISQTQSAQTVPTAETVHAHHQRRPQHHHTQQQHYHRQFHHPTHTPLQGGDRGQPTSGVLPSFAPSFPAEASHDVAPLDPPHREPAEKRVGVEEVEHYERPYDAGTYHHEPQHKAYHESPRASPREQYREPHREAEYDSYHDDVQHHGQEGQEGMMYFDHSEQEIDDEWYPEQVPGEAEHPYFEMPPSPVLPHSPPLVQWNPALEPPPDTLPASAFAFEPPDAPFENVWDRIQHHHRPFHPQEYSTSDHSPPRRDEYERDASPESFFCPPTPPAIPAQLMKEGHYAAVTQGRLQPDRSKVNPVFPWESKPRPVPGRKFPEKASPPPIFIPLPPPPPPKAPPKISDKPLSQSPTKIRSPIKIRSPESRSPRVTSPIPKNTTRVYTYDWRKEQKASPSPEFVGRSGYSNVWDDVAGIQQYASGLVRPSSALGIRDSPPPKEEPIRHDNTGKAWRERTEDSDASSRQADDEDDESDLEEPQPGSGVNSPKATASKSRRGSGKRSPPIKSGIAKRAIAPIKVDKSVETTYSGTGTGTPRYRSQSVQTEPKSTQERGVQVNRPPYSRTYRSDSSSTSPIEQPPGPIPLGTTTPPLVEPKPPLPRIPSGQTVTFAATPRRRSPVPVPAPAPTPASGPVIPSPERVISPRMNEPTFAMTAYRDKPPRLGLAPSPTITTPAAEGYASSPFARAGTTSNRGSAFSNITATTATTRDSMFSEPQSSPRTSVNLSPILPTGFNPHIRTSSNETGITGPTATTPPSSIGPSSPADDRPTKSRKAPAGRQWDPRRNVDIFKSQSQEVLARFLQMGSWDGQKQDTTPS